MRGKVTVIVCNICIIRITPAYAGKRQVVSGVGSIVEDHPRLCGEKRQRRSANFRQRGSPPPMRGKDKYIENMEKRYRITPAYAGKRVFFMVQSQKVQDHPRLCGEKASLSTT